MKANVTKAIGAMIIALFVSQNVFAQPNGNPNPNALWKAKGKDTVETNRVVKVNNNFEADNIHSKGVVVVGDSSFAFIPNVGPPFRDEIRSSLGRIAMGRGDSTSAPNFDSIKVGIGTQTPGFMLDVVDDINIGANQVYRIGGQRMLEGNINHTAVGFETGNASSLSDIHFSYKQYVDVL